MRTSSRRRGALVAVVVLVGLLGAPMPPAHGATVFTALFTGVLTFASPFGHACVGHAPGPGGTSTIGTIDPLLCPSSLVGVHPTNGDLTPTALTRPPLTLQTGSTTTSQTYPDFHHNRTTIIALAASSCLSLAVNNVGKTLTPTLTLTTPKALTHAGSCSFVIDSTPKPGGNTAAGVCRLVSGQIEQFLVDSLGQVFSVDLHLLGVGAMSLIDGHATKLTDGQRGLVAGWMEALPPIPVLTPDEGCLNKTARTLTILGALAMTTA